MPNIISTPEKNQLKKHVGLMFNDMVIRDTLNALLFLPDVPPSKKNAHKTSPSIIPTTTHADYISPRARSLADPSFGGLTPEEWRSQMPDGDQFFQWRQHFREAIITTAHSIFRDKTWSFWEWTQLDFLIGTWPSKQRNIDPANWIPDWPSEARQYVLNRYAELEQQLHQRDKRGVLTKEWTNAERTFYSRLWHQDPQHWAHDLWQRIEIIIETPRHQKFIKLLRIPADVANSLLWHPWAYVLRFPDYDDLQVEETEESKLTQAYLEQCAIGAINPNDPEATETFRNLWIHRGNK